MTALKQINRLSADDYLTSEQGNEVKHEYLGGTIHAMAGATNRHNAIAGNCFGLLHGQLRGKPCQAFNSDTKARIQLSDHVRFYYPAVMVVCEANPAEDQFQDRPVLIAEVLSDSTRRTDLGEKSDAYLSIPSLKILLLIESDSPSVVVCRRDRAGIFQTEHHLGLDSMIPLPEIDASLEIADLYERVEFGTAD